MADAKPSESEKLFIEKCIRALYEKDRLNYPSKFVQGFVHNINGTLQRLLSLTETLITGLEHQDRIFRSNCGEDEKWSELQGKQQKRLDQMREQIAIWTIDMREFMQLHEIERSGTEVDINALLTIMAKVFRSDNFFKHNVKPELRLARNLPHIKVLGRDMVPAIFHLFQNAIMAMKESSKKELIVETSMHDGQILVRITDSGSGLGEEQHPEVFFDLFESRWLNDDKSDASSKGDHLGFGLYAAKQLLLPYGFTVLLERMDEGTSALIRMPVRTKPA